MPPVSGSFFERLSESGLLRPAELLEVTRLWERAQERGVDASLLPNWLVARHYLTWYQAQRLLAGKTRHFYMGRYKLLSRLGQGLMGRVYKAVSPDGHSFAVKVLPPSVANRARWRRLFDREAREAARYLHPNIVHTIERGRSEGLRYLVMEYIDGETLAEVLKRRRRLPPAEAVRIIYQALQGLQHLHDHGTVHWNIEPAHLMITPVPPIGQPDNTLDATIKLMNAGLGRPLFDVQALEASKEIRKSGEAPMHGEVDYLAPELAGNRETADIRADVYSLGCVLFRCLTGHPPYPGGTILDRVIRHSTEPPAPLDRECSDLPKGLSSIVERMMAREPSERYSTPAVAARALREFLPPERPNGPIQIAQPVRYPVAEAVS